MYSVLPDPSQSKPQQDLELQGEGKQWQRAKTRFCSLLPLTFHLQRLLGASGSGAVAAAPALTPNLELGSDPQLLTHPLLMLKSKTRGFPVMLNGEKYLPLISVDTVIFVSDRAGYWSAIVWQFLN